MLHGYMYNKLTKKAEPINIPSEIKFTKICIDEEYGYTSVFDGTKIRLFASFNSSINSEFELSSEYSISEIEKYNKFKLNNFIYFVYIFIGSDNKEYVYCISIDLDNQVINDYILQVDEEVNSLKNHIISTKETVISSFLYDNRVIFIDILNGEKKTVKLNFEKSFDVNSINFVDSKMNINDDNKTIYSEYDIEKNRFPLFCGIYNEIQSILFFVNIEKEYIRKKIIFNDSYSNIKKCLMTDENHVQEFHLFDIFNNNLIKTIFKFEKNKKENIHTTDTDIIIDAGSEIDEDEFISVNIKSYGPSFHGKNKTKFYAKDILIDTKTAITKKENEVVSLNSIDNEKNEADVAYINEDEIYKESFENDRDDIEAVIENSESIENIDNFSNTEGLNKYDENRYSENLIAQEFSANNLGVTFNTNKENNARNSIEIISNENTNMPIEVEGINSNVVSNENEKEKIIQINSLSGQVDENLDIIFPFLNLTFKQFGVFSYSKEDLDILYPLYVDSVSLYKKERNLSNKYNQYKFSNEKLNQIINFIYEKINNDNVSKTDIAHFIGSQITEGESVIYLDETDNLYKFITKNNSFEFN